MALRLSTTINRQLVETARRHFSARCGAEPPAYVKRTMFGQLDAQSPFPPPPPSLSARTSWTRNKEEFTNLLARKISDLQQMKSTLFPGYYVRNIDAIAGETTAKVNKKPEMKVQGTQVNFISPVKITKPIVSQSVRNYVTIHYRRPRLNNRQFVLKLRRHKEFVRPKRITITKPKINTDFVPDIDTRSKKYLREPIGTEYYAPQRVTSPYPSFSELRGGDFCNKYAIGGYTVEVPIFRQSLQCLHTTPTFTSDKADRPWSGSKKKPCTYKEPPGDFDDVPDTPHPKKKKKTPQSKKPKPKKKAADESRPPLTLFGPGAAELREEPTGVPSNWSLLDEEVEDDWLEEVWNCPSARFEL